MRSHPFLSTFVLFSIFLFSSFNVFSAGTLTSSERILYQQAIEEVYWQHRLWPAENPKPKPKLEAVMPYEAIQNKVEDTLRKSNALEKYYQRAITGQQLQAEIERMASQTKDPAMLRAIWSALNNDPYLIAEVLARPILVDRLLRESYSRDERIHGAIKELASAARNSIRSARQMQSIGGEYREIEWVLSNENESRSRSGKQVSLTQSEWDRTIVSYQHLQAGNITELQEDQNRFYVQGVLQRGTYWIRIGIVEWKKTPYEKWWKQESTQVSNVVEQIQFNYELPEIAEGCAGNTWQHMPSIPNAALGRSVWTGTELIVWGELFVLYSGGRYSPATDSWHPISGFNEPSWRNGGTAVWSGTEMIIWGGWGGLNTNNVLNTGGRYNPSLDQWLPTSTASGVPSAREAHSAIWTGQEMVIWAGRAPDNSGLNTGARYNPVTDTWNPTTLANAPEARMSHLAEWSGNVMIVWGGVNSAIAGTYLANGSRYNPSLNSWTPVSTTGAPAARSGPRSVWTGTEMILWGGTDPSGFTFLNTGARYNPATNSWSTTSTTNAPIGRKAHSAVWTGTEMIIWGGCSIHDCSSHNSTGGRYNPVTNSWIPTGSVNAPTARSSHQAVWTGTEMIVWGGCTSGECQIKLFTGARYSPASNNWIPMNSQNSPRPRVNHSAVWTGAEMIIWGGYDSYTNSTGGRYDPATDNWTDIPIGGIPGGRDAHSTVWTGTEMIVWGGRMLGFGNTVTGGRFNPATTAWTETNVTGAPTARAFHSAVWNGTQMVVWGGCLDEGCQMLLNTGGRYTPSTNSWQGLNNTGAPSARFAHSAVMAGNLMIIWGGITDASFSNTNTGARYNASTNSWQATTLTGAPSSRYSHSAVGAGTQMIVWGGTDGNVNLSDGKRYVPSTNIWTSVTTTASPVARRNYSAIWTGSEMIIWGGCADVPCSSYLLTGARYDPASDSWKATSTDSAPSARSNHTAVWTGTQMLIWGGNHESFIEVRTGGNYCITSTPDFGLSGNPSNLNVNQGNNGTVTVTVNSLNGFNAPVSLSCFGNPVGVTCQFNPGSVTPPPNASGTSILTVSVAQTVLPGSYPFDVQGVNNGVTRSFILNLTVSASQTITLTSLTLNPSTVIGTNSSEGTVTLSNPAPAGGILVSLSSSNPVIATTPPSVTVLAGAITAKFPITTSTVSASNVVNIFATYAGVTKSASLTVTTDTVAIQIARYKKQTKTLTVQATSNNPTATTLRVYKTSTNAFVGTLTYVGNNTYSGNFSWPKNPQNITVRSILGGSASRAVTLN